MRAADEVRFREYVTARWPALVRTAALVTGDAGNAEDLVQSALVRVYSSWSRVSGAQDPDAYVMRILLNTNKSRFRKRRVPEHLTMEFPEAGAAPDAYGQLAERSVLFPALMALPPGQRAAVILRYWADFSEQQTAQILGCAVGTVKSQAAKGLVRLRADAALSAALAHHTD